MDAKVKMTFGLTEKNIKTIDRIIDRWNDSDIENLPNQMHFKHVWEEVGREIGWEPFTAALHYWRYKDNLISLSQSSLKEEEKEWNCNNCEYVFNEYDATIDLNGTERCPKCDFALGGIPQ